MKQISSKTGQQGNVAIYVVLFLVVIGVVTFAGLRIANHHKSASTVANTTATTTTTGSTPSTALSSGANNTNLDSDLNNINGSLNQASQSSSNTSSTLTDQQNEIAVPTN